MANEYDPRQVKVIFGPLILNGLADGEMVSVAYQADGVSVVVGGQGDAVLVDDHDDSAEVTVRFHAAHLAGQNTLRQLLVHYNAGNLALPFAIESVSTGESLASPAAKIKMRPDTAFADGEAPVREVVFVCSALFSQTKLALTP